MFRHFTGDQVLDLLGIAQFELFLMGKFEFNVTKKRIFEVTDNINYFTMPK
jgi:hypothetical protein